MFLLAEEHVYEWWQTECCACIEQLSIVRQYVGIAKYLLVLVAIDT